ncbi:hypothetical protein [Pantoea ananatis]|uniref:hypothetical protein n=1 Tax=Pantoea ananas TaxID=553 RepID=UPI000CF3D37A|nr:hypothetical protein [Pantoea ananatis]PQK93523.1 hypothetical protein CG433_12575 [Pantoea ananatis]
MNDNTYHNGKVTGTIVKATATIFSKVRFKMLAHAGGSRIKIVMANAVFISMIFIALILVVFVFYNIAGLIGLVGWALLALLLPKSYSIHVEEVEYDFNDGYRDGPEGYGYYSGGYKINE